MKIHKLHIHNIASIEDATIDFRDEPLAGSDVFLITGKTGAGKSTILDAISLALFNTTPRLFQREEEKGHGNKVANNADNLTLDDPRQLMRRETGEASVELLFEGKDGRNYEAIWHVQRGQKKKVSSELSPIDWSLKCIDNGEMTTGKGTKVKEVERKIVDAIGLEFDQFCRTTMLAQGEFTRFLKSPEDKKSEILAKITQFTEYAEIGKKIFEIDSDKKKALDEAIKNAGDTGKTPEELKELNDSIEDIRNSLKHAVDDRDSAIAKKTWLDLQNKIDGKYNEISTLQAELEKEDFRSKKNLVSDWDKSVNARQQLGVQKSKQEEAAQQGRIIEGYRSEYASLLGVLDALQDKVNENKAREQELTSFLDSEKSNKDVYANAGVLIDALKRIAITRSSIKTSKDEADGLDLQINGELKDNFEEADNALSTAKRVGELLSQAKDILDARLAVNKYEKAIEKHRQLEEELKALDKEINDLAREIEAEEGKINEQSAKVEVLRKAYDRQMDTVTEWAKSMRSKISSGEIDVCPVCGQKVADVAFNEQELSSLYESAKKAYEDALNNLTKLKDGVSDKISIKSGKASSYASQKKSFEDDRSVAEAQNAAQQACKLIGISLSDTVHDTLSKEYEQCRDELSTLGYSVTEGKDIAETTGCIKNLQKANNENVAKNLEKARQSATDNLHNAEKKKVEAVGKISTLEKQQGRDIEIVEKVLSRCLWYEDPKGYAETVIKPAAEKYAKADAELNELSKDSSASQLKNLDGVIQQIVDLFPEWKEDKYVECKLIDGALDRATSLFANIKSASEAKNTANNEADNAKTNVEIFIESNPSFTPERLCELSEIKDVENIRQEVNEKLDGMRDLRSALAQLEEQSKGLKRPEVNEEDTVETLADTIEQLENVVIAQFNQQLGAKNKELEDDRKKKEGLATLETAKEAAQKDYDEWHVIAKELGDSEGKRFQRIAQSFILGNLLNSANSYLKEKKLAERYTLKAVPNTLHISIEDAYQGYATRSTDSLSGGESFLVSLALALALSDIGEGLAVDTLFIDEGFGTLSGEPLTKAINVLRTLHNNSGRHIGIISHIEEVKNNIPVQIQVEQDVHSSSSTIKVDVIQ